MRGDFVLPEITLDRFDALSYILIFNKK